MDILSYRGPGNAGGVSSALARVVQHCAHPVDRWWYLSNMGLAYKTRNDKAKYFCRIPSSIVDGHYRYCNNFLWPVMHDFPKYALFSETDRKHYQHFNMALAHNVMRADSFSDESTYFVQDYQLALTPNILSATHENKTSIFWHIPWPKYVDKEYVLAIGEIAQGMLASEKIGFHIEEYAQNFLRFVQAHLPQYLVDHENMWVGQHTGTGDPGANGEMRRTQVQVKALGLDMEYWQESSAKSMDLKDNKKFEELVSIPFFLSVDRSDYTKGILERIKAIDAFYESNPAALHQFSFVQICQPSRIGLDSFDHYWNRCLFEAKRLNSRWGNNGWKPLIWIQKPMLPSELSCLYKNAIGMLVTPIRDGLNLTAKEFVACSRSGALILSAGAGVWHELQSTAIAADPCNAEKFAAQIKVAMAMSENEKTARMSAMRSKLKINDLETWWQTFVSKSEMANVTEFRVKKRVDAEEKAVY